LPGASLPLKPGEKEPFTIKVGKIRGVESHGMMCSPQELGLSDPTDGLLLLREDATVGQPFAEYLGLAGRDVVYDLEVTPNRPDLNSVIGIAREISALTGNPLKLPELSVVSGPLSVVGAAPDMAIEQHVGVRVDEPELCPRYTARLVNGVKVGPSPDWLRTTLEKVGIRSINNVVDATNYVMLETGQPLHAFDYHLIEWRRGRDAADRNPSQDGRLGSQRSLSAAPRRVKSSPRSMARSARSPPTCCSSPTPARRSRSPVSWAARTRRFVTTPGTCSSRAPASSRKTSGEQARRWVCAVSRVTVLSAGRTLA